jgi:hypothetical protein
VGVRSMRPRLALGAHPLVAPPHPQALDTVPLVQVLSASDCNLRAGAFRGIGCTGLVELRVSNQRGALRTLEGLAPACGPSLRKLEASGCGLEAGELRALNGCPALEVGSTPC